MPTDARVSLFRSVAADLGEGAVWHPRRQSLFWVDILGKKIHEASPDSRATLTRPVPQYIGALVPTIRGDLLVALQDGIHRYDLSALTATPFACPPEHQTGEIRFNDAKCDPQGRLWAGTMALDESPERGALYRIATDGSTRRMRDRVTVSNGLAWSPDHRTLYYIDSPTRTVQAFDYDETTGDLHRPRVAIDTSIVAGFPDGCTIDVEGNLWIAFWDGWCVSRWDPVRGRLLDTVKLPVARVTTCTFGGANLTTLYITSASCRLSEADRREQPEAGFVFAAEVGTSGFPTDCFAG
jgi:sugar lactone lactonase YvrE